MPKLLIFFASLAFTAHMLCVVWYLTLFIFSLSHLGDCLNQRVFHLRFCDIVLSQDFTEFASRIPPIGIYPIGWHVQHFVIQHEWDLSGTRFSHHAWKSVNDDDNNNNYDHHHYPEAALLEQLAESIRGMHCWVIEFKSTFITKARLFCYAKFTELPSPGRDKSNWKFISALSRPLTTCVCFHNSRPLA